MPIARVAPGLDRMLHYERPWLRGDVIAGITVAAYLVPQVMAYAEVAGLPAVTGLWVALGAMVVYAFLGSSRHLSVGPETTTALMTAAAVGPLALGDPARYAALAAALTLLVAVLLAVAWLARLGFLADLLSKPVLVGYLAGVAVVMVLGQLDKLLGVSIEGETLVEVVPALFASLSDVHVPTFLMGLAVLVALFAGSKAWPTAPVPLFVLLAAAAVVSFFDLTEAGLTVVGTIPADFPKVQVPAVAWSDIRALLLAAVGVTMVAFNDNALTGRAFAAKGRYSVDANQELLALGGANLAVGLAQGFPVSSSGSRTVIAVSLNAQSQLYSLVAAVTVLLTLFFLRPVLGAFPEVALAAVVIWAALRLVDVPELKRIANFRRSEFLIAAITTVGVLLVGILGGVVVAISLSIVDLLRRMARPHDGVLGYVPGVPGMHDIDDYPEARQMPGLMVYRYDAPLFFANAENFKTRALESLDQAQGDVDWFLLNFEANVHIDLTAVDALDELREELERRGIVLAMARVRYEIQDELEQAGFIERIGADRVFATLPTAVLGFVRAYTEKHGVPPEGVVAPKPPEPPIIEDI